jgi:hypothetical protein
MAVFESVVAFLGKITPAWNAMTAMGNHSPCDAVAGNYGMPNACESRADGLDPANDFMAQNCGHSYLPAAVNGMQVATTHGGCCHPHQNFTRTRIWLVALNKTQLAGDALKYECPTYWCCHGDLAPSCELFPFGKFQFG